MKTISTIFLTVFLLLQTTYILADDPRVMVAIFESEDGDEETAKKLSIICSEEVMRFKGVQYMSPTEFVKIVTGNEEIRVDKPVDLKKEYGQDNVKYLEEMSHSSKGTINSFFKAMDTADILVGGKFKKDGPSIKVDLLMARLDLDDTRQYEVTIETSEGSMDKMVSEKVGELLGNMTKPL
ncbi:MAG TPA: hypothetical protein PLV52_00220 [Candidatus Omnitrophota bacterium]|nr:hypothetical protein [Candidatus Omnitrophota bacterium]